jgi:hypothetical protein
MAKDERDGNDSFAERHRMAGGVELHSLEAHRIGRKDLKIKRCLDDR